MQPCWSFVVMDHDCDHELSTSLRWWHLCFYISFFDYALADLWDYDVIYGSLRFVPVVTRIDVVSWGCSMITLRCVQRLHCVLLLPCYTGLDSCTSGYQDWCGIMRLFHDYHEMCVEIALCTTTYYIGLGSCSNGQSCLWMCSLICFKCLFMLLNKHY